MLAVNQPCFLLAPNEQNKRLLIPGNVLQLDCDALVVACFDEPVSLKAGDQAMLFAEWRGKFYQQPANIESIESTDKPKLHFTRVGEPMSADSRASYRVSVATHQLVARVDNQAKCHLVDLSPEGCAVICPAPLTVGQRVNVCFAFQGIIVEGKMNVQTFKQLNNAKIRFGLLCIDKQSPARRGLEKLTSLIQRHQLKRLSGAV